MTRHNLAAREIDVPTLRIKGPGDLLQAVPYLLGFHPQASLVIVGLHASRLVVTVRLDLVDLATPHLLGGAIEAMHRGGASELVAALYDDAVGPGVRRPVRSHEAVDSVHVEAARVGCTVLDVLRVSGGRWWSFGCAVPECCPPEGRALPSASSVAAAATYAGMVALPDRAALNAILEPRSDADREWVVAAIGRNERAGVQAVLDGLGGRHQRSVKRALFAAARGADACDATGEQLLVVDEDVARFGVALREIPIRDAVWMAAEDGRFDGRALWADLARRLPTPYDAPPLFLFGWCAWRSGNGALAGIAAERAVSSDPGYSAADLLLAALSRGLDPRRLPRLRLPRTA
ncbi:MAG: hypothetical protein JWO57_3665 [Pseudonocardiales bacterium]|nr:hypothetical protein [Pseudonocardiales bacterium]